MGCPANYQGQKKEVVDQRDLPREGAVSLVTSVIYGWPSAPAGEPAEKDPEFLQYDD